MGFEFKLEALRRYRLFEQEQMQKTLAEAQRDLELAKTGLERHIALRDATEAEFHAGRAEAASACQAGLYRHYLNTLANEIETLRHQVTAAETLCEQKRQALMVAVKKRKALDRLKEKGGQAYLADANRKEEKFINEMAISRYGFKQ
jgi:flagellar protein FliJ